MARYLGKVDETYLDARYIPMFMLYTAKLLQLAYLCAWPCCNKVKMIFTVLSEHFLRVTGNMCLEYL